MAPSVEGVFPETEMSFVEDTCAEVNSLEDEVKIQCDASQSGLGAALIQLGLPVALHHML